MNERLAVTRRVLRAMRHSGAQKHMDDPNAEGVPQIVICVPDDTIAYACERVKAVGGRATVVTPHEGVLMPLGWTVTTNADRSDEPYDGPMHPESSMGMLMQWWLASGQRDYTFRVTTDQSIEVSDGEQLTIPA